MSRRDPGAPWQVPPSVLLAGFGAAHRSVARSLLARGHTVAAFDDRPDSLAASAAQDMGVELETAPDERRTARLLRGCDLLIPTPGLPEGHRVLALAGALGVPTASELDLARAWDARPIASVTGTSGKTTTAEMVVAALEASGIGAVAAGNNELPLVDAIERRDADVFVVEASSFRLAHSQHFEPRAACWLNFAPDHLDVHRDLGAYESAKARIWRCLAPDATAVANRDDPTVMGRVRPDRAAWTFAAHGAADWRVDDGVLAGPGGPLLPVGELRRAMPHDVSNALAAAATATAVGATAQGVREALAAFEPGAHRLQFVASIDGVDYYDDSKATTPHAAVAALRSFEAAVLIAGGRNKGLDLRALRGAVERVRAVVAVGEAAEEIAAVFAGLRPTQTAADMHEAVCLAASAAEPGTVVLLSPACASFDGYSGYAERGDHFAEIVAGLARRAGSFRTPL